MRPALLAAALGAALLLPVGARSQDAPPEGPSSVKGVEAEEILEPPPPPPARTAPPAEERDDREIDPVEPDFVVVNLPTQARIPRAGWAFRVTHRFSRPLGDGDLGDLAADLFG